MLAKAALCSKEKQDWRKGGPQDVLEVQVKNKTKNKRCVEGAFVSGLVLGLGPLHPT